MNPSGPFPRLSYRNATECSTQAPPAKLHEGRIPAAAAVTLEPLTCALRAQTAERGCRYVRPRVTPYQPQSRTLGRCGTGRRDAPRPAGKIACPPSRCGRERERRGENGTRPRHAVAGLAQVTLAQESRNARKPHLVRIPSVPGGVYVVAGAPLIEFPVIRVRLT